MAMAMAAAAAPLLRVRLLTVDYAMVPPREEVDVVALPRRERAARPYYAAAAKAAGRVDMETGTRLTAVPVLRVVGLTPAGQSVCLHVHQVFPYMFVPYPDTPTTAAEGPDPGPGRPPPAKG